MNDELVSSERISQAFVDQLSALETRIAEADRPGDLDGLFARHILGDASGALQIRQVDRPPANRSEEIPGFPVTAPALSALAYMLTESDAKADIDGRARLLAGLRQLMRRDPFAADRVTFLHDPRQLLGIALGALAIREEAPEVEGWLRNVLGDSRLRPASTHQELLNRHVLGLLSEDSSLWAERCDVRYPAEPAILHWTVSKGTVRLPNPASDLKQLQRDILEGLLRTPATEMSVLEAAFLRAAAGHIIQTAVTEIMFDRRQVGVVLRRFTRAMRRWRWDDDPKLKTPIQWPIVSEREVQDILWLLLSAVFVDLIDEETLRKVGHSSYRADFGIPSLGVLIEIKYARTAIDFKKIEKEVMEDHTAYLKDRSIYKEMVVFIYDASSSVQEHGITEDTLLGLEHIIDVVIVSRPSHLPGSGESSTRTPKRARPNQAKKRPRASKQPPLENR